MKNLPFQGTETDSKRIGKGCQKNDSSNSPFAILSSTFCHPFAIILRSHLFAISWFSIALYAR